jgi:peptidoglycan hydrolase-like protein with peptidoglycan-binding domain
MKPVRTIVLIGLLGIVAAACGDGGTADTTTTSSIDFTDTTLVTNTTVALTTTTAAIPTTQAGPILSATDTIYRVQIDLKALGFFDGQIDGISGEETQSALKAFQTQQGISADGEFGPQTDAALYPLLMEDSDYVENLQKDLADLGLYTGPIDGDYGKGTKAAVQKLQGSCDLEQTGVIDIRTRICLDHAG